MDGEECEDMWITRPVDRGAGTTAALKEGETVRVETVVSVDRDVEIKECTISSISIHYKALETLGPNQDSRPVVQIHWQTEAEAKAKNSAIIAIIYKRTATDVTDATVHPGLVHVLVKDTQAIHRFARDMLRAFNVVLTTVTYPPLEFEFLQTEGHQHLKRLFAEKKHFVSLLRKFLLKDENFTPSENYIVTVRIDENKKRQPCQMTKKEKTHYGNSNRIQKSFSPKIEGMFDKIEQELSSQGQYIETQLREQDREYNYINEQLATITECLGSLQPASLQYVTEETLNDADADQKVAIREVNTTFLKRPLMSKYRQNTATSKFHTQSQDIQRHLGENHVPENHTQLLSTSLDSKKRRGKITIKHNTKDDQSHSLDDDEADSAEVKVGTVGKGDISVSKANDEIRKRVIEPGRDDDLYMGQTGWESSDRGSHYTPSFEVRSQPDNIATHQSDGADYSPHTMGTQHTSSFYEDEDYIPAVYSTSNSGYSRSLYPSVQVEELNFNLQGANAYLMNEILRSAKEIGKEKTWEGPAGRKKLSMLIERMIQYSPARERLLETFELAMEDDGANVPRTDNAIDTVICLDTSGSMTGEPFHITKQQVLEFIDGIEAISTKHDIEENIALVTFGGRAKVVHHLSNDYGSLREALDTIVCGGPGPILEGLVVSLACLAKGGAYKVDHNMKLTPRLVIFCDGLPTGELPELMMDTGIVTAQDIAIISKAFAELATKQIDEGLPSPVVFVPPYAEDTAGCMVTLASNCGGVLTYPWEFADMAKYQRLQLLGVEALRMARSSGTMAGPSNFYNFLIQIASDINKADSQQIYDMVMRNKKKMLVNYGDRYSFYNIKEVPELPRLGSRVTRGPDWQWGNQDTEGPGTVINHSLEEIVWVCWDNDHVNVYRYGHNRKYDVVVVTDQPRVPDDYTLEIGVQVKRGPDWHESYGDQDGGRGQCGTVIRNNTWGQVMVRWPSGKAYVYRCSYKNDVVLRDPIDAIIESTAQEARSGSTKAPQEKATDKNEIYIWQRKDPANGWESYTESVNTKLKKEYSKNPQGSCVIQRNLKSFRVSFRAMEERSIEEKINLPVRRLPVDGDSLGI